MADKAKVMSAMKKIMTPEQAQTTPETKFAEPSAKRPNNLGKFLHPKKVDEGSKDPNAAGNKVRAAQ